MMMIIDLYFHKPQHNDSSANFSFVCDMVSNVYYRLVYKTILFQKLINTKRFEYIHIRPLKDQEIFKHYSFLIIRNRKQIHIYIYNSFSFK